MAFVSLSRRDINVLQKIKDPEFDPSAVVRIEQSSSLDPHITDPAVYQRVARREREIVFTMQEAELEFEKDPPSEANIADVYRKAVSELGRLVEEHPNYASARNNRVQAMRRLYGDDMLVSRPSGASTESLLGHVEVEEQIRAAKTTLANLDKATELLSPSSPFVPISPTAAKTLSLAHTQRAAIYHATSRLLGLGRSQISHGRREAGWRSLEFEAAASRDFAIGGKYGNEIAKGLAVSTNPTAKLCGQMVQEMMKREYGEGV